jgi:hypothetical protein
MHVGTKSSRICLLPNDSAASETKRPAPSRSSSPFPLINGIVGGATVRFRRSSVYFSAQECNSVVSRRHFFSVAPDWSHATGTMMVALGDLRGFVGE